MTRVILAPVETARRRRTWISTALIGAWIAEWLFVWTEHLGPASAALETLWLVGLVVLVVASQTRTRLSVGGVAWGWMLAVLGVTVFRAWWLGLDGPLEFFTDRANLATVAHQMPGAPRIELTSLATLTDQFFTPLLLGVAGGLVALFEIAALACGLALGRALRGEPAPARVGLLPRALVVALQVPTLLATPAIGLAIIAGVVATFADPANAQVPLLVEVRASAAPVLGIGGALWLLGVIHLRRLQSLRDGRPVTRLLLGAFAIGPGVALVLLDAGIVFRTCVTMWVLLQLAALALARPRRPVAAPRTARPPIAATA